MIEIKISHVNGVMIVNIDGEDYECNEHYLEYCINLFKEALKDFHE
jgi:hypothetical protein